MTGGVLIVDDHLGFRARVRQLLERAGYVVVGEAGTGGSALREIERLHPDVVLLDVQLPDMPGFAVARAAAVVSPRPKVVLVSVRSREEYGGQVEAAPVAGFLDKDELSGAALRALLGAA